MFKNESTGKSLSIKTLRLLHRCLDDFTLISRVKSGSLPPAELSRLLRAACASDREIHDVMVEYHGMRSKETDPI
jgi:hypothetical protein